jgi:hypothetical protein
MRDGLEREFNFLRRLRRRVHDVCTERPKRIAREPARAGSNWAHMLISEIISGELAQDSIKLAEMSGYECPLMAQSGLR